ncbi:MAG: DUF4386 family protein [Thermomicrobiales bacterium]
MSYLLYKSNYVPRIVAGGLSIAALIYLTGSFIHILAPSFEDTFSPAYALTSSPSCRSAPCSFSAESTSGLPLTVPCRQRRTDGDTVSVIHEKTAEFQRRRNVMFEWFRKHFRIGLVLTLSLALVIFDVGRDRL